VHKTIGPLQTMSFGAKGLKVARQLLQLDGAEGSTQKIHASVYQSLGVENSWQTATLDLWLRVSPN
jgi:hypothetical protein